MRLAVVDPVAAAAGRDRAAGAGTLRIGTLLQGVLLLLLVANLGRIPLLSTEGREIPVLLNDLAVGALLIAGGLAALLHRRLVLDRVAVAALVFAAVGAGSALYSVPRFGLTPGELAVSLAYLARWLFYFGVYVVAINGLTRGDVEPVWTALERTLLLFAAFGVVQAAFLPNFALVMYDDARPYIDWDPQGHRLVSTFLDPNFAGAFLAMGLLVQLARLSVGVRVAGWKPVLLFGALLLTLSRGAMLSFVVACGVIVLVRGISRRLLKALLAGGAALLVALPFLLDFAASFGKLQVDASAMTRVASWARTLRAFADHPVIGIGFNTWGPVQERYGWIALHTANFGADGGLLFIAALTGTLGLGAYVAIYGMTIARARRTWRDPAVSPEHRGLALGATAVIVLMLVQGLFTNNLLYPFLLEPLWVLLALTAVIGRSPEPSVHASHA